MTDSPNPRSRFSLGRGFLTLVRGFIQQTTLSAVPTDVPVGKWMPSEGGKGTFIVDSGGVSGKYPGILWDYVLEKLRE